MDRSAYQKHYQLDQTHFWRIAKRRLVLRWLEKYIPHQESQRILDIGGGCSVISGQLRRFGDVIVVEPDPEMAELAETQLGVTVQKGSLPQDVGVNGQFDVITLLDVLEHVDDDTLSLQVIHHLMSAGGVFVCTVPAYQWLWSDHDVVLHHKRRYTRRRLRERLQSAGFRVERISYYTSLLLPVVALQRITSRFLKSGRPAEYSVHTPSTMLNGLLSAIMSTERGILDHVSLPFGSALIAICRKDM